jgi:mRNA interferase HicA
MKRKDLLRQLQDIAIVKGLTFEMTEGGNHSKLRIGGALFPIPRHREINERLARAILSDAENLPPVKGTP